MQSAIREIALKLLAEDNDVERLAISLLRQGFSPTLVAGELGLEYRWVLDLDFQTAGLSRREAQRKRLLEQGKRIETKLQEGMSMQDICDSMALVRSQAYRALKAWRAETIDPLLL